MFGKGLILVAAICGAGTAVAVPPAPLPAPPASETGGQSYGDRNRGGPYGFYSYPRHRSVDSGASAARSFSPISEGTSPYDNSHGSAYYGRDYGAPYFGGGYYDGGVYYRERRD